METHTRPKSTELVPSISLLQDGNSRDHQALPSARGVGHLAGFQRRLFSYPDQSKVAEVPKVPSQQPILPIHLPSFRPVDGSIGVHQGRQGGQANGTSSGYPNPLVPRRLISESPLPGNVPTTYSNPFGPMSQPGLGSQQVKVGTGPPTGVQLRSLPFRPLSRPGQTHAGEVDVSDSENQLPIGTRDLFSQAVYVPHWSSDSHGKTGGVGTPSHETYQMAFKEALARPGISRESDSPSKVSPCSPKVVVGSRQGAEGSTLTPITARPSTVYRRLKQRLGRTLRRLHRKRPLVQVRRRLAHKFARTQGGPFDLKTVRAIVLEPDHLSVHGQHDSGFVHQQGRGYEIRLSLCPPLETPSLVQPEGDCVTSPTHPGSSECHCRQTVPTQTGDSDRMVSPSGDFRPSLPEVAHTSSRFICNQVQSQTSQICVSSSGQVDALNLRWEDLDAYAFPPTVLLGQVVSKLLDHGCRRLILIATGWPNMPWFWDLVSMSVQIPLSLPKVKNLLTQPFNQCPHRDLFNLNLHAWLLKPQPFNRQHSLKKWQHELKLLGDAKPELSTSQSGPFLSDGVRRIRWTSSLPL